MIPSASGILLQPPAGGEAAAPPAGVRGAACDFCSQGRWAWETCDRAVLPGLSGTGAPPREAPRGEGLRCQRRRQGGSLGTHHLVEDFSQQIFKPSSPAHVHSGACRLQLELPRGHILASPGLPGGLSPSLPAALAASAVGKRNTDPGWLSPAAFVLPRSRPLVCAAFLLTLCARCQALALVQAASIQGATSGSPWGSVRRNVWLPANPYPPA